MYGGSILPGKFKGQDVTVQNVFEAVGQHSAGKMSDEELHELNASRAQAPGPVAVSLRPTPWPAFPKRSVSPFPPRPGTGAV